MDLALKEHIQKKLKESGYSITEINMRYHTWVRDYVYQWYASNKGVHEANLINFEAILTKFDNPDKVQNGNKIICKNLYSYMVIYKEIVIPYCDWIYDETFEHNGIMYYHSKQNMTCGEMDAYQWHKDSFAVIKAKEFINNDTEEVIRQKAREESIRNGIPKCKNCGEYCTSQICQSCISKLHKHV